MVKSTIFAVLVLAVITVSCGGGMSDPANRQLLSLTVTPATADAQSYPNGQVPFVATGHFSDGTQAKVTVLWTLNPVFSLTPSTPIPGGISLSSSGMAQCTGFTGSSGVFATRPVDVNMPLSKMTMLTKNVSGTALLTCP